MSITVTGTGGLVTIQDRGRVGCAHLGVPRAGALDGRAAELANRLVGNPGDRAVLEATLGGVDFVVDRALTIAVTGAECEVTANAQPRPFGEPVSVAAGSLVRIGPARLGVRTYVAVSGGIAVPAVLGSRSTDTLAFVGPPVVVAGTVLPVGTPVGSPRPLDVPVVRPVQSLVRLWPGPRLDWFVDGTMDQLRQSAYTVTADSNRVGLRLDGPRLVRIGRRELPSEGLVTGAVQVPPDGKPVILLNDHPVTGGYPVVAVVDRRDLPVCAQLRPGDPLWFTGVGARGG